MKILDRYMEVKTIKDLITVFVQIRNKLCYYEAKINNKFDIFELK